MYAMVSQICCCSKLTMVRIADILHARSHMRAQILLQIHDEIILEVRSARSLSAWESYLFADPILR